MSLGHGEGEGGHAVGVLVEPEGEEVAHRQRLAGPRVRPILVAATPPHDRYSTSTHEGDGSPGGL